MRTGTRTLGAGLLGLSLVAAACGGGDGGGETAATVDAGVKAGIEDASKGGTAITAARPAPTSMDAWETLWTEERAAIVRDIKDNKWGKSADGRTVTGPDGFTIDLSKCPAGWSDTEGLSDTSIKIGHTTALSGTLADYGNIPKAMNEVFAYYGQRGAFRDSTGKNRTINLVVKDDAYDAARTIPLVDELIDSEKVFAMWTLGSPNTMKTYDKLNQRCIPQPLSMTGHPAWGDPVNHPWTTGFQLAYNTEAVLWGNFIEQRIDEFDGEVSVAALIMNNDFGKSYDAGFKAYLAQSPVKDLIKFDSETVEASAPTMKDPMTTLAAGNPDVFIAMVAGTACTQTITEAAENGMKESVKYLFQPSVCAASTFVGKDKVGGDGASSDGWWIVNGGTKDLNDAGQAANDVYVRWARELLQAKGIDPKSSGSLSSGFLFAFPMVQALQIAGELDGGLNRTNFMTALRSLDMTHPFLLEGIRSNMSGNADPYFVEGGIYQTYDSAKQGWENQSDPIDLSGKSKPCVWDQAVSNCK